ncbi:MAG: DUF302 domain-containing protein [Firmicutes bacterium]|nr:DUF302 domain-containing protein [Bacillota bacterium]
MDDWIYQRQVPYKTVDEAVAQLKTSLGRHQFGVLWDLDINEKLAEKGVEPERPYRILEVCSAPRAKEALATHQVAGYFLPCKVVVYEDARTQAIMVGFVKPEVLMGLSRLAALESLAHEVHELLRAAVDEVAQ